MIHLIDLTFRMDKLKFKSWNPSVQQDASSYWDCYSDHIDIKENVEMSSNARRQCSFKIMLDHMCLHSLAEFYMCSNGIFCNTHHIAPTSFLLTSTFFHVCSSILNPAQPVRNEVYLFSHSHKVSGPKTLKNFQNISRKS